MHRRALTAVGLAFTLACTPPAPAPAGTEDGLRAALATYDSAWLAKDRSVVERTLSPEYTYFTSLGGVSDKATTLTFLTDTGYALTLSRRTDVRARIVGSTAVISSRWEGKGRYRAEVVNDDQTCGMTWVWVASQWQLLGEHCVNRPAAAPEAT